MSEKKILRIHLKSIHNRSGLIYFSASHTAARFSQRGMLKESNCEESSTYEELAYIPKNSIFSNNKVYVSRGAALIEFVRFLTCYEFIFENNGQEVELQPNFWYYINRSDFEVEELANRTCIWQEAYIALFQKVNG